MNTYLIRLFDHGGNVRVADWILCEDDAEAIRRAKEMDVWPVGVRYEVTQGDRLVHSHSRRPKPNT